MKICLYCAQANTRKNEYGYCKRYNCFEVSGDKSKFEKLQGELREARSLPTYKRNQFDGSVYNPRKIEERWVLLKIQKLLGFVPLISIS